jgi:hypothetical protein
VYVGQKIARIALAVDKGNLRIRMIKKQSDEFAGSISRTA